MTIHDIYHIRRVNLDRLIRTHGSASALSEAAGMSVSRIISVCSPKKSDPVARSLEAILGLEAGWMDQEHDADKKYFCAGDTPEELASQIALLPSDVLAHVLQHLNSQKARA